MSTLSGNASKGEKGKKFQQLKINLCTANKPSEPEQHQHKSSIQRKQHGMTPLGKVPTARRPTILPSEKSEHSGNDQLINLVPSGGAGWGNKQNETVATTAPSSVTTQSPPISVPVSNVPMPGASQPVPHVQHYPPTSRMPPLSQVGHVPVHHAHADMKTWAMMTQGGDSSTPNFLTPQSPLFQHEFPSLSANSDTSSASAPVTATATQKSPTNIAVDTQYGPGPSLRPQTEGSWIQGGSRPQGSVVPTTGSASVSAPAPVRPMGPPYPPPTGPDGARNNLAPSGVGVVPGGPYPSVMPQHMIPPQYNGLMPPFMLRNSFPGAFPPNFQQSKGVGPRPQFGPYPHSGPPLHAPDRFVPQSGVGANSKRVYDDEDVKIRSIIKEEDLNKMATIGNDIGWAGHEDIDYNQKLKFSDDEDDDKSKDNRTKLRSKMQISLKTTEKLTEKKEIDQENDLKSSKESLKEREKAFSTDIRGPEMRNAWIRRPIINPPPATSASRYQIPSGRFEEDDEAWQEKRRQKKEEMEIIMQRAKERKEEEEKRFTEQQQAAQIKLKKLEASMFANSANKENKGNYINDRDLDMLPEWEKEKVKTQCKVNNENQANDDTRKTQNAVPVPVVKDASEFRELTQLVDRSNFVKKDTKERENSQIMFSRGFNNVAPRFQNLNRQNSGGFSNSSSSSGPPRSNSSQQSQGSGKLGNTNFGASRHNRVDSESLAIKNRDWSEEDDRKDQENDRYSKEVIPDREYAYDRLYENNFKKEYDPKRKYLDDKDEYTNETYRRDFDSERETNFSCKIERKNSESERDKSKTYDYHRYPENDANERWRQYDEVEKSSHPLGSPRQARTFSDSENHDNRRSREDIREINTTNAEREREHYRKTDSFPREKSEPDRENERSLDNSASDYKKESENDIKKDQEFDSRREKERERKSPSPFDDRFMRNELKECRFNRESRESLRDESYVIQEGRSYHWTDDHEVEEKPKLRREHYREDRGDRYSHAQRHPPGPITRAKLEAKELESDSKRNLTALVRSDKKAEVKKSEFDEVKEKDKSEKLAVKTEVMESTTSVSKSERLELAAVWKRDDKKENPDSAVMNLLANEQNNEINEASRKRDDDKNDTRSIPKLETSEKSSDDRRNDRRKSDRRNKSDPRNWTRYSMYRGSSYGGSREPKARRSSRGGPQKSSRRDSKYSESDFSDEVSGSGREDKSSRMDREKSRPVKSLSKRYERDDRGRDDRGRDYRMDDRDYGSSRGRNSRDTYYSNSKPPQRSRGIYHGAPVNKRMDVYGTSKSHVSTSTSHVEDKRLKSNNKEVASGADQNLAETRRTETVATGKTNTKPNVIDRSWKKNYDNPQEIKSTVSSPASTQTAEANEESFATASEGSDSEETALQTTKTKSSQSVTKRSTTVVVAKPPRNNFRSSSRKRYDNRRTSSYSRKDSGSYSGTKKNVSNTSSKPSVPGKENDRGEGGNLDHSNSNRDDFKSSEKSVGSYADPGRKNIKPRNRSNSRKNVRSSGIVSGSRVKNGQDFPLRSREKPKGLDGKVTGEAKDFRSSTISMPFFKEVGPPIPAPPPTGNAWDKPLTGALRNGSPSTQKLVASGSTTGSLSGNHNAAPVVEKNAIQTPELHPEPSQLSSDVSSSNVLPAEKVLENLDGASPPVQTIIFENTNFRSGPSDLTKSKYSGQLRNHRFEKDTKLDSFDTNAANYGNASSNCELPNGKQDPLQMALFNKNEDVADMKLDFTFDSEFSKLTEDNKSKSIELTHAMHIVQASTDAELNFKIASVKKVWDGEHDVGMVNTSTSFSPAFSNHGSDPNNSCYGNSHIENTGHVQVEDVNLGHNEVVFSNVSQMQAVNSSYGSSSNCQTVVIKNDATSSSSNVCKVKPQPQGSSMANVPQSAVISTSLATHPPPMSSPSYNSFSCSTPQPNLNSNALAATALAFQQYTSMPQVPSSPVLFNSSQTGTAAPTGIYPAFQIDNAQVAARSAFSQFSSYGLTGSAFNQQSVFVQPPTNAPPPDIYPQQVPQYRLPPQPFGNTQQITSQNTVLISSSSNSLMSASIKPSNQQISVIGTKPGPSSQFFMPMDHATQLLSQNLLPLQRPGNNVVPGPSLQASTSFYSSASGTGQTSFFAPGTGSGLQPQPGAAIGLPMFNAPSASQSLGPNLQNFNSQLSQYRSTPTSYLTKSGNTSGIASDFGANKAMTIPNQHDIMNQAYQSNSQIASNKQRLQSGGKNMPSVQQAVAQHSMSQNAYNYQPPNQMRNNGGTNKSSQYPHPIQRPVSQGNNSNRGGNNTSNNSASHRMPVRNNSHQLVNSIQQPPSSVYYSASSGFTTNSSKLEASQLDAKADSSTDSKLTDSIKTINAKNTSTAAEKNSTANE